MTLLRRIPRKPVFSGQPVLSGHLEGYRGCPLNTGLTVIVLFPPTRTCMQPTQPQFLVKSPKIVTQTSIIYSPGLKKSSQHISFLHYLLIDIQILAVYTRLQKR